MHCFIVDVFAALSTIANSYGGAFKNSKRSLGETKGARWWDQTKATSVTSSSAASVTSSSAASMTSLSAAVWV